MSDFILTDEPLAITRESSSIYAVIAAGLRDELRATLTGEDGKITPKKDRPVFVRLPVSSDHFRSVRDSVLSAKHRQNVTNGLRKQFGNKSVRVRGKLYELDTEAVLNYSPAE